MVVSRIFWDTSLLLHLIQDRSPLADRVAALRTRMLARGDQLLVSTLTLGELDVKPLEARDDRLRLRIESALTRGAIIIPFDEDAARWYATIRLDARIQAPDAIQLACAARAHADLFITNDDRLSNAIVPGVQFVTSVERAVL